MCQFGSQFVNPHKSIESEVNLDVRWRRISHTFVLKYKGYWIYRHSNENSPAEFSIYVRSTEESALDL